MHHILAGGKYYLFSVLFHAIFLFLLSVFVLAPLGETSLQAQGKQERTMRVSFNKSTAHAASVKNNFAHIYEEKNISSSAFAKNNIEEQISNSEKNQDDSDSNMESIMQGSSEAESGGGVEVFEKAYLLSELEPVYPPYAVKRGIEGSVLIQANIDRSGNVSKTEIILSSKYEILDKAAIRCVKKAKFAPASCMGNPAPDILRVAVNFNLN